MSSQTELETAIKKTVNLYNRLKSPEAIAKAVRISTDVVTIAFSGSFCYNCAIPVDYVQDFIADFRMFNDKLQLKILATKQISNNSFEVDYLVTAR